MKRYRIEETLVMGFVDIPDDVAEEDVLAYLDANDAWPDDEEVVNHEAFFIGHAAFEVEE